jgi:threonine/homoserine efflux transporter RhtA
MLNRPLLGVLVGAGLGAMDGLSALVSSPEVRDQIGGIVVGSSFKGLLAGVLVGLIARKLRSSRVGVAVGVVVAAVITLPIAYMNATHYGRPEYYWKIMLPGALVGAMVGYVVMRYGRPPLPVSRQPL